MIINSTLPDHGKSNPQTREYKEYFAQASDSINEEGLVQRLKESQIDFYRSKIEGEVTIRTEVIKAERRGAIVYYRVYIGQLGMTLRVLNLPKRGMTYGRRQMYKSLKCEVFEVNSVTGRPYVCKRYYFNNFTKILRYAEDSVSWNIQGDADEMNEIVKEYGFAKICSALGIGVKVGSPDHPFDLVCYENFVEFFMERCQPISAAMADGLQKLESRLKYCVAVMHRFGLIHKDIKPPNLLVNASGMAVIADFDVSTHTTSVPGQEVLTYREGTPNFMSSTMFSLGRCGKGYVDLYFNDLEGLRKSLEAILKEHLLDPSAFTQALQKRSSQPVEIDDENQTIIELGTILSSKAGLPTKSFSALTLKKFAGYFHELGEQVEQRNFNIELLVRVFGVTPHLLYYLQQLQTHTLETRVLLSKLLRRMENVHMCSSFPFMPHKLELLKKEYNRLIKEVKESGDVEELALDINKLGLSLVEGFLEGRFYEEALEVFQEIQQYTLAEKSALSKVLRVNTETQKPLPDRRLIEELLSQLAPKDWMLIDGATYSFERDDYAMSLRILQFLFGDILAPNSTPSPDSVLGFLEEVLLQCNGQDINKDAWRAVWVLFSQCAINTMHSRKILETRISYLDQLPASCRLEVSLSRANAFRQVSRLRQALVQFDEALKLCKECFSETSLKCVIITLEKCDSLTIIHEYETVESTVLTYLNYVEVTMDEMEWVIPAALKILMYIDSMKGRFEKVAKSLIRALKILRRMPFNTHTNLYTLVQLSGLLSGISVYGEHRRDVVVATLLLEECMLKPFPSILLHKVFKFKLILNMVFILSVCDEKDKANQWEKRAFEALESTDRHQEALEYAKILARMAGMYYRYFKKDKQIEYGRMVVGVVQKFRADCSFVDILGLSEILYHLQEGELAQHDLIDTTMSLFRPEFDDLNAQLQFKLAKTLHDIHRVEQSYIILKPMVGRSRLCTGLAARCSNILGLMEQSEHLCLQYLDSDRNLNVYEEREMAMICHNVLQFIYLKKGSTEAHRYHYQKMVQSFESAKPIHFQRQVYNILELLLMPQTEHSRSIEIRCRKRLLEIATTLHVPPRLVWMCYSKLSQMCYDAKDYQSALQYFGLLGLTTAGTVQSYPSVWGVVRCCVILGKPRRFYASANELAQHGKSHTALLSFLSGRREYIKMYLLQGSCPESCKLLKLILDILQHGISEEYLAQPLKRRTVGLAFAKKLRVQMLHQKGSHPHEVSSLIRKMKECLG